MHFLPARPSRSGPRSCKESAVAGREPPRTLGAAIEARRREFGWPLEAWANRVVDAGGEGFRQSDVSRLERGKVGLPRRDWLGWVAVALGLPLGKLLARPG